MARRKREKIILRGSRTLLEYETKIVQLFSPNINREWRTYNFNCKNSGTKKINNRLNLRVFFFLIFRNKYRVMGQY